MSVSIAADRRLMAMLEELERGLRRAEAVEKIVGVSLRQGPVSSRPNDHAFGARAGGGQKAVQTLDRAMAVIVSIWIAGILCSLLLNQNRLADITSANVVVETTQSQPASVSIKATPPAAQGDGLSVEEFEIQVRRILAEKRKRAQTAATAPENNASNADDAQYAFPLTKEEPLLEPLAPLPAPHAEPEKVLGPDSQIAEFRKPQPQRFARAKASAEKARKSKIASKPVPPAAPVRASPAPLGLFAFVTKTTDNITKFIKKWTPR